MSKAEDHQMAPYESALADLLESGQSLDSKDIQDLVERYPAYAQDIKDKVEVWQDLDTIVAPLPSGDMDHGFYTKLKDEVEALEKPSVKMIRGGQWSRTRLMQVLAVAATFFLGCMVGTIFRSSDAHLESMGPRSSEVSFVSVDDLSAPERMKQINLVREEKDPDEVLIRALHKTLISDPNVNVRLSALETLVYFGDLPLTRQLLIDAIPYQQSSILLLELAGIMEQLEASNSASKWGEVLQSEEVEPEVKKHLKENLKNIL